MRRRVQLKQMQLAPAGPQFRQGWQHGILCQKIADNDQLSVAARRGGAGAGVRAAAGCARFMPVQRFQDPGVLGVATSDGASCVDLFAGSGALGLEAASRGASRVVLVEKSKPAAQDIRESVSRLNAVGVEVVQGDAMDWLAGCEPESLDIVFIDPPFGTGLEARALELLKAANCLRVNGVVYVETARESPFAVPGTGWEIEKEKLLGDVCMRLLKKN